MRTLTCLLAVGLTLSAAPPAYAAPTPTPTPRPTSTATPTRSATPRALSPIDQRWSELGGQSGWVGAPTSGEYSQNGGRVRTFVGADIGWTEQTGAKFVMGAIRERHRELGGMGSFLGQPRTDEIDGWLPGTRRNDFVGGTLYYTFPRAFTLYGLVGERYRTLTDHERREVGLPTSDEVDGPLAGSRRNRFERGEVSWHPAHGAHAVYGAIFQRYDQIRSTLGSPTSGEVGGAIPGVRLNRFERGTLYWSPTTGAHEVFGAIGAHYAHGGAERSELGLPTTGEYGVSGGLAQDYQYGRIVFLFNGFVTRTELHRNPEASPLWADCTLTLNGAPVTWRAGQRTLTVVNGTGGSYANLKHFVRRNSSCGYDQAVNATARVGYNGIADGVTRVQGSGTTPAGTYTMTESYGSRPNPGSGLPYVTYNSTDRWVMDSNSLYYNNFRNPSQGGFSTVDNEPLADSPVEFEYFIPVNFNRAPDFVRKDRGAGVFLHVHGPGATAACISVTREEILTVLRNVRSGDTITIVA
ncbi:L,D-transpeptidase family protein [Mariniluteicoccus flavus]